MSELSEAINEMRNMRESYDQIGAAAEAYNAGKAQLVENINSKGVPASATETLPELAGKVAQIAQETTIYEGADSYGKQIGAGGSLWDLYQVLADMKTRFIGTGDYAALIVCEYYKGYPSLVLQGADGYYTCDGDYYDYASPNHVWHDDDNGKMNRWVAFLYRDEGARLDITNTSISPRSMYIGGHIGTIEYFVNGRLTDLVCGIEETDILDNFLQKGFTQSFSQNIFIKAKNISGLVLPTNVFSRIEINRFEYSSSVKYFCTAGSNYISIKSDNGFASWIERTSIVSVSNANAGNIYGVEILGNVYQSQYNSCLISSSTQLSNLRFIRAPQAIQLNAVVLYAVPSLIDLEVGALTMGLWIPEWNPAAVLADASQKAILIENIKNHILARVSDRTGLSQLVFTVSANMYNNIASEQIEWQGETMSLADAFLTKNWNMAGR